MWRVGTLFYRGPMPKINESGEAEFNFGYRVSQSVLTGELTVWCDDPEIPVYFVWREWMQSKNAPEAYQRKKKYAIMRPEQVYNMFSTDADEEWKSVSPELRIILAREYEKAKLRPIKLPDSMVGTTLFEVERTPGVSVKVGNLLKSEALMTPDLYEKRIEILDRIARNTKPSGDWPARIKPKDVTMNRKYAVNSLVNGSWADLPNGTTVIWDADSTDKAGQTAYFAGLIDAGVQFSPPIKEGYERWKPTCDDRFPSDYYYLRLDGLWAKGQCTGMAVSAANENIYIRRCAPVVFEGTAHAKNYALSESGVFHFDIDEETARHLCKLKANGIGIKWRFEELR